MKKRYGLLLGVVAVLSAGLLVPLGSYVPTRGVCPDGNPPVVRLHLITGDSIQKVKAADTPPLPNEGCARQVKYVLYML